MEPDPIGLEGGLNPYAYAGSNPVMNVDPSGLMSILDDAGLSAVTGFDYSLDQMILNQQIDRLNRSLSMQELSDYELSNVTGQMGYGGVPKKWSVPQVSDYQSLNMKDLSLEFQLGGHVTVPPMLGVGLGGSVSGIYQLGTYPTSNIQTEAVLGSLIDVGVGVGVNGFSRSEDTPWSLGFTFPLLGKYGGAAINFKGINFDGAGIGLGLGLTTPINITLSEKKKSKQ